MLGQIRFGPRLELENRTGSALSITSHDEEEVKLSEKWTRKDDEPDYKNFLLAQQTIRGHQKAKHGKMDEPHSADHERASSTAALNRTSEGRLLY
ncbi:unnamed protein product [Angiostrongylus costaricensis]|uniref:Uncharacterized protein n=1 Tax=Angiostrongylus costaricensis TaxID=334426 RepID=A0A0R3PZ72_ANGCS|nr:unnamed protein product [Angiostrongylus costaricensis]